MTYVIRPSDREAFKRCRRAWDFSSPRRAGYEPVQPLRPVDFDRAIRDALAVYYFPGMWEWDRAIVRPLARDGFVRTVDAQRAAWAEAVGASGAAEPAWDELMERGLRLLDHYFDWAPTVDDFSPVRVEVDFDVRIPDPRRPLHDLSSPTGEPVHYAGRLDLLVVDEDDNYWVVEHRLVGDSWTELDHLCLDDRGASFCWAWELFFLGMKIAGVIFNELRTEPGAVDEAAQEAASGTSASAAALSGPAPGATRHRRMYVQAERAPSGVVTQSGSRSFRRTRVPKSLTELSRLREQMAYEALDMVDPGLRIYPNPSVANCSTCAFRAPCIATNAGDDVSEILAASYRQTTEEVVEEGRLGGVSWSMNRGAAPPKFGPERGPAPRSIGGGHSGGGHSGGRHDGERHSGGRQERHDSEGGT